MADQFHVGEPHSLFPKRAVNSNLGGQGIHYDCSSGGSSGENVESRNSSTPVCLVPALLLHPVLSLTFPAQEFWVQCISVYLLQKITHGGQLILACVGPNLSISCAQVLIAILYLCVLLFNVVKHYLNIVYQI